MKVQAKRVTSLALVIVFAISLFSLINWHAAADDEGTSSGYTVSWATTSGASGNSPITEDANVLNWLKTNASNESNITWFYCDGSLKLLGEVGANDILEDCPTAAFSTDSNGTVVLHVCGWDDSNYSYSISWSSGIDGNNGLITGVRGTANLLEVLQNNSLSWDAEAEYAWYYVAANGSLTLVSSSDTVASHAEFMNEGNSQAPTYRVMIGLLYTGSGDTGSGDTGSGDTGSGDTGSGDTGSGDSGEEPGDTGSGDGSSEFEPGDFSKLEELIEKAEALNSEEYTEETWAALESALADAKALLQQDNVSASEISAAESALQSAMDSLVKVSASDTDTGSHVDKSELESAEKEAGDLHKSDYTEKSWKDYEEALAAVEAVLNNPDATQEEIDAAYAALNKAVANLEEADDDEDVAAVSNSDSGSSSGKGSSSDSDSEGTLSTVGTPQTGVSNGMMYALAGMSAAAIAFLVLMLQEKKAIVGRKYSGRRMK